MIARRPRPIVRALAAGIVALSALVGRAARAEEAPVRLRHADGREEEIATAAWDGVAYVSASDASRIVGAPKRWLPEGMRLILRVGEVDVRLTLANPVAVVDEKPVLMPGPLRIQNGVFWVPLDFVATRLVPLSGDRVAWWAAARRFVIEGGGANVRGLAFERRGRQPAIRIDLAHFLPHEAALVNSRLVEVTLHGGVLPPDSLALRGGGDGIVASVAGEASDDDARLRLALTTDFARVRTEYDAASKSLRVILVGEGEQPDSSADSVAAGGGSQGRGAENDGSESGASATRAPSRWPVETVVIDPGHGGPDNGVVGAGGTREKDVALAIALAARDRIEQRLGLRVVLTRDADALPLPEERAQLANAQPHALFISLHCGAWSAPSAAGFAVAYAGTIGAPATEAGDSAAGGARPAWVGAAEGGPREVRFVPWNDASAEFAEPSGELAELTSSELSRVFSAPGRGVSRGEIAALRGVQMPAIFVEVGLLTNEGDEKRLASADFRAQVADALEHGIAAFTGRRASVTGDPVVTVGLR